MCDSVNTGQDFACLAGNPCTSGVRGQIGRVVFFPFVFHSMSFSLECECKCIQSRIVTGVAARF